MLKKDVKKILLLLLVLVFKKSYNVKEDFKKNFIKKDKKNKIFFKIKKI